MKQNIKRITSCLITVVLIICLVKYMGYRLDPAWSQDGFDVVDAYHSLENDSLDVIVYGSSRAWKGFDTRVLNKKYGISSYNYGCNWQAINTILLFLQDSLTTQTPKVVCIETGLVDLIEQDTNLDGQIYYSSEIPTSKEKIEYLTTCFGKKIDGKHIERYISYMFPLIMFHENWNSITYENYLNNGYQRFVDSTGYCEGSNVYECTIPDYKTFEQSELSEDSKAILDKMVAECKERNIDIIFYTCPYEGNYNYGKAMEDYAVENNCIYLNLFVNLEETGIDGSTDFQDAGHLNSSGASKLADYIGKYIYDNYDIGKK